MPKSCIQLAGWHSSAMMVVRLADGRLNDSLGDGYLEQH